MNSKPLRWLIFGILGAIVVVTLVLVMAGAVRGEFRPKAVSSAAMPMLLYLPHETHHHVFHGMRLHHGFVDRICSSGSADTGGVS